MWQEVGERWAEEWFARAVPADKASVNGWLQANERSCEATKGADCCEDKENDFVGRVVHGRNGRKKEGCIRKLSARKEAEPSWSQLRLWGRIGCFNWAEWSDWGLEQARTRIHAT